MITEMILLRRSKIGRFTGQKIHAVLLEEIAKKELPNNNFYRMDTEGTEHWNMEKQFWLKHKRAFQDVGFMPERTINATSKKPYMMENF